MFDRATTAAERALGLTRDEAFAQAVRERLALYQKGRPYRAP
jgi:hypothetical protein